jgi:hypothetical protein
MIISNVITNDGIPDFLIIHHHYLEIMTLLMIV